MKNSTTNTQTHTTKDQDAKNRLLETASLTPDTVLEKYNVTLSGRSTREVERLQDIYGKNVITKQNKDSTAKRLFRAFIDPFIMVLIILAAISFVTDVLMAAPGQKDPWSVVIVMVMVLIAGILQFVQESRSNSAAEKLSAMVETTIAVQRDGKDAAEIPIDEIVIGDIITLAAGDMVPADLRIIQAKDLFVSQSSLTGESEPTEKFSITRNTSGKEPLEMDNLAFMGSTVISGSALAVTINIGDSTIFGSIAKQLSNKKPPTSFEKGISSVSWLLIRFMMVMVPVVFILGGFRSGSWMDAFLFALSVAVGLTPAMLPTIVAAGLARGATALSKKKVIVKDLNSIQNFGAMDILCTDKTGTLTQDKVTLMYSLNVRGSEDPHVLKHAFLNSYYQTGLKNLMDIAVLDYAKSHPEIDNLSNYQKLDEIPFDFARRRMSVVVQDNLNKIQMITKGAIEEMLAICSHADIDGTVIPITPELHNAILAKVKNYNEDGMRVLGIAHKTEPSTDNTFSVADENNMVLIGYLAFLDPPKESSATAIKTLRDYGVEVKILTGDNEAVTRAVCRKVGISVGKIILGTDVEARTDEVLDTIVEKSAVFAKLSPQQKSRVVAALRRRGHTVGYMGDGINDAAAMKQADVGISVDTAVDIAKESANIILLDKDLMVLEEGIIEGRKTYANIIKYIKMTISSNFGNILSILAASAFLPFLPMLPLQLLVLNLIYDISCIAIPWDNVDPEFLKIPRKWNASSISKFMFWFGPISSFFDITTFLALYFWICPAMCGGAYHTISADAQIQFAAIFHTGWFIESLWSQTLVIHMIRTPKIPFFQSRASIQVLLLGLAGISVGTILPYIPIGAILNMSPLPFTFYALLAATVIAYIILTTIVKKLYIHRYKELL
ncbi:MAG: magnesium-translocating P-type ATPase [Candidatus Nomurabacteria bacterium]|jgi:Mg2+-importing ATPase|nr:magnesium-translocating P-type ATPase [Candidatus Nomurabacteria bacterium]